MWKNSWSSAALMFSTKSFADETISSDQHLQDVGCRKNDHAECSHVLIRRRERKSQNFRSLRNTQKLLSAHDQVCNYFNYWRHLISISIFQKFRNQAQNEWNLVTAPACVKHTRQSKIVAGLVRVTKLSNSRLMSKGLWCLYETHRCSCL